MSAPISLEMPAGTGKTHLLAAAVAVAAERNQRSLILTHTNAGVDALRKRLKQFGVPMTAVVVDTITSWSFTMVRSYPEISGITVPEVPDWSRSKDYLAGSVQSTKSQAIQCLHEVSFDYFFVDEYQDCTEIQHDFVLGIHRAIPKTVVFGDRLQGIFGFSDPLINWDSHVLPNFPHFPVEHVPRRWANHNLDLGRWTLSIRAHLKPGNIIDWSKSNISGVIWGGSKENINSVAFGFRDFGQSVVVLDKWANDVAMHASRLGGNYSVMEDIQGRFMRDQLQELATNPNNIPAWITQLAKKCFVGFADLDRTVIRRLEAGQTVSKLKRPGFEEILAAADVLSSDRSEEAINAVVSAFERSPNGRIYRREAWRDTTSALRASIHAGTNALDELARVRDKVRRAGRRPENRIASRTLLVKGLEYDHVIIADIQKFTDPENLYVALSRARKSVTVLGDHSTIQLS